MTHIPLEELIKHDIKDPKVLNSILESIKEKKDLFKATHHTMSELEQKEAAQTIQRLERVHSSLLLKSLSPTKEEFDELVPKDQPIGIPTKDEVDEFLTMEKAPAIEMINFLLTEFFTTSYKDKEFSKEFIGELMFETTRVINLISKLKPRQ
jgi:hypothetical protein